MEERYEIDCRSYLRVVEQSCAQTLVRMQHEGFLWADRTIGVTIQVDKVMLDLKCFQRLPMVETEDYKDDIFRIAHESFSQDRRFHVAPDCNRSISSAILKQWVESMGKSLVAFYHDKPIGFLNLQGNNVHLAAVEEKFRPTGAALGLYARAIEQVRERGFQTLEGRISSLNVSVMNLYANFGAKFSRPEDIFLKEIKTDFVP